MNNKWNVPTIDVFNGLGVVDGSYLEEIEQRVARANEEINERVESVGHHNAAGDEYMEIVREVLADEGLMLFEDYSNRVESKNDDYDEDDENDIHETSSGHRSVRYAELAGEC